MSVGATPLSVTETCFQALFSELQTNKTEPHITTGTDEGFTVRLQQFAAVWTGMDGGTSSDSCDKCAIMLH